MPRHVLLDGDVALFQPAFGAAVVAVQPGTLTASGPATLGGKKLAIDGDEKSVSVPACSYFTPSHPIAGAGTLEISALGGDQKATKTCTGGKAVLLVGGTFTAAFAVQVPAQQPTPGGPVPDPTPRYSGSGSFQTSDAKLRGT